MANIQQRFEALRLGFLAELPAKLRRIEEAAAKLPEMAWDAAAVESLHLQVHRLAGASGVYGLTDLSRAGGALERWLTALLESGPHRPQRPTADLCAELAWLLGSLKGVFSFAVRGAPMPECRPDAQPASGLADPASAAQFVRSGT